MLKSTLVKALTVIVLVGTPVALNPTIASAAPTVNSFQIPLVYNSGTFSVCGLLGLCVTTPTVVTGETPGTVTFPVMGPYEGTYWMHWRNLGTGAAGVEAVLYNQATDLFTGAGPVILSMTNEREVIAGTGVFWVP
ncbi:hypothetical protein SIM91_43590 [Rhodococcus opacus]|uniref:hypothetical protein n=1 Tax=Rhodococcus opacus TaxID=37919 RepID=UPI0002A3F7DF|nr:hypothetical protein [Rhodococcus opacus]ELB89894.1 hypothetical protein Rwratislav_27164 [Rhodococcus wratislaviensis IFP 2016]MDX5970045.1 hypothetical protein [Rhodococcus opacus]CAG7634458.1 hypothetical protein E143388_07607 [Rhodococcus opacus]